MVKKARYNSVGRKKSLIIGAVVLLLVVIAVALYWHNHRSSVTVTNTSANKSTSITAKGTGNTPAPAATTPTTPASKTAGGTSSPAASTGSPPANPSGIFVSNHHPGQYVNGQATPQNETSNCITTSGASCYISFTMGGVTKQLPAVTADASGNASWSSWTAQSVGLTSGSWVVKAVATQNGQAVSTQDPNALEVQ